MRALMTALALMVMAGAADAESTQADWDKYAQPLVDVFGKCARSEVDRTWKTSATAEEIAAAAVATCEPHLAALKPVLVKAPFNANDDQLAATFQVLKTEMHDTVKADVEKRRKEE